MVISNINESPYSFSAISSYIYLLAKGSIPLTNNIENDETDRSLQLNSLVQNFLVFNALSNEVYQGYDKEIEFLSK